MVRKLMKHEFIALTRRLLPFEIAVLAVAVLTRVVQLFEGPDSGIAYSICLVSSIVVFCVAAVVLSVDTLFTCISRFYKNLFTLEGYLSFTLPVTAGQHLFVKLFAAIVHSLISTLVIAASILIATLGEVSNEILKCVGFIFKKYFEFFNHQSSWYWLNAVAYIIEAVLVILAGIAVGYLLYYTCICIGQLAKKNRILAAVGVYFAIYIICQFFSTVFIIVSSTGVLDNLVESIGNFAYNHYYIFAHIALLGALLVLLVLGGIYLLICRHIMCKKLNLE